MASVTLDGNSLAAVIGAIGGTTTAIISALNRRSVRSTESKVDSVHDEVKTSNGHTLAEIVEQRLPVDGNHVADHTPKDPHEDGPYQEAPAPA